MMQFSRDEVEVIITFIVVTISIVFSGVYSEIL